VQDSTYEFEKRRNVPVRYDRELIQNTVKAMQRVSEIRQRREHAFWKNRYVTDLHLSVIGCESSVALTPLPQIFQHGICSRAHTQDTQGSPRQTYDYRPCRAYGGSICVYGRAHSREDQGQKVNASSVRARRRRRPVHVDGYGLKLLLCCWDQSALSRCFVAPTAHACFRIRRKSLLVHYAHTKRYRSLRVEGVMFVHECVKACGESSKAKQHSMRCPTTGPRTPSSPLPLTPLVLGLVILPHRRVHRIRQPKQRLANRLARSDHRPEHRDRYRTHNCVKRAIA